MLLSRRLFLGGALALTGTLAVSSRLFVPIIIGDGIHDDWEGLEALVNREPVRILTDMVRVGPTGLVEITGGTFALSRTLRFGKNAANTTITKSVLRCTRHVEVMLDFTDTPLVTIELVMRRVSNVRGVIS